MPLELLAQMMDQASYTAQPVAGNQSLNLEVVDSIPAEIETGGQALVYRRAFDGLLIFHLTILTLLEIF